MRWRHATPVLLLAIGLADAGYSLAQQPAATATYATSLAAPEELAARIETILEDPALTRAHVGLVVQVAETGEVLFDLQGDKLFVPASNTKIVTAAIALEALGPAYRWESTLAAAGQIRDGVLEGDLWIIGAGDPWLSRETVWTWPAMLRRAGIQRITGDVIGDDRRFAGPQWGQGWFWHEIYASWAAGVSALQVRPNTVRADLIPGERVGDQVRFQLRREGPGIPMEADVRTGAPGSDVRLRYELPPEGGDVRLTGWIPAGDTVPLHLATHHPTLYLLDHLEQAFDEEGIEADGVFRRAGPDEAPVGASWSHAVLSDSLGAAIAEMLKPSDNQVAESILRTVGYEAGAEGSAEAGLDVARGILAGWGIEAGAMTLSDGSGLSRYNRIAPSAMARLLRTMWQHPEHAVFLAGLPVAAVDGTMRSRLSGTPAEENVMAKTGSLAAARALSGYLTDGAGETLVFSLMLNGYEVSGSVAVALEDLIIEQIALYRRPVQPGWPQYREGGP